MGSEKGEWGKKVTKRFSHLQTWAEGGLGKSRARSAKGLTTQRERKGTEEEEKGEGFVSKGGGEVKWENFHEKTG